MNTENNAMEQQEPNDALDETPINKAIKLAGGIKAVAKGLDFNTLEPVYRMIRNQYVPFKRVIPLEKLTGGEVTRYELDPVHYPAWPPEWRALITFMQMIVLCDADGALDMTRETLARRTGIPLEYINAGIEYLEMPYADPNIAEVKQPWIVRLYENSQDGWIIVNPAFYSGDLT